MNVILLIIWMCVLILTLSNVYYNNYILINYQKISDKDNKKLNVCDTPNVPTVDIESLTPCGDDYSYTLDGKPFKITTYQTSYTKVCAHYCKAILQNGKCAIDSNNDKYIECENKFKPQKDCNYSIKPIVYVQDGTSKTLYYPEAPILNSALCFSS